MDVNLFPGIIIGPAVVTAGVLIIVFRHPLARFISKGLRRMYDDAVADSVTNEKRDPTTFIFVGVFAILLGGSALARMFW